MSGVLLFRSRDAFDALAGGFCLCLKSRGAAVHGKKLECMRSPGLLWQQPCGMFLKDEPIRGCPEAWKL